MPRGWLVLLLRRDALMYQLTPEQCLLILGPRKDGRPYSEVMIKGSQGICSKCGNDSLKFRLAVETARRQNGIASLDGSELGKGKLGV